MSQVESVDEPKVSVILTSYNRPFFLKQAIDSVMAQTYQNWELLVMDDNSPGDDIDSLMSQYNDSRIMYNKSDVSDSDRMLLTRYAVNINKAFSLSSGAYITYLTDDDIYLPNRLADMSNAMQLHDVVYGGQACTSDGSSIDFIRPHADMHNNGHDIVDHCSVMHTREVFEKCDGWDENPIYWHAADGIFWNRIASYGYKMYPVGTITDIHRFHSTSIRHKMINLGITDLR
jgi:spore maturation protein CgeD